MKYLAILSILFLIGVSPIKAQVVDVQGIYYMSYYNGEYKETFRVPENSWSYGFGMINESVAVFTYQDPKMVVATAIVNVISLDTGELMDQFRVDNAGETSFHFNGNRGVFNDSEGIKVIDIIGNKVSLTLIKLEIEYPFAPFWINSNTIGFSYFKDGKQVFEKVRVPAS